MELEVTITEQVQQTLKLVNQTIPPDASLIEFGLHSLAIMQLVDSFQAEFEVELNYVDFASMPTIRDWVNLLNVEPTAKSNRAEGLQSQETSLQPAKGPKEAMLSEMQYSFWAGQQSTDVSAHLYVEFDGSGIDPANLNNAIKLLLQVHPMLRAVISNNGSQTIAECNPEYQINIDDISEFDDFTAIQFLADKREKLAHQILSIEEGEVVNFDLTVLPDNKHRLHIDVNMVAADAPSILLMYDNLAALYEGKNLVVSQLSYFDYLQKAEQDANLFNAAEEDKKWWQARLADIPPPPKLPLIADKFRQDSYKCHSHHHTFSKADKKSLVALADHHGVSISNLMLAVFSSVVAGWSTSNRFRLNLPMFKRSPYGNQIEHLIGDFTNLMIFSAEIHDDEPLSKMLKRFESERQQCLDHSRYSGINILRDLSKLHEDTEVAPIVYTCGFGQGEIISESVQNILGKPTWCVSQGPMVDLDVQVAEHNQGILINWDVRTAAFKPGVVDAMFDAYLNLLQRLITSPQNTDLPLKTKVPLLQKQYRSQIPAQPNAMVGSSLHRGFWQQVVMQPDNTALIIDDEPISYHQLANAVNHLISYLKDATVEKGGCIAIDLEDPFSNLVAILGGLSIEADFITLDSAMTVSELETLCGLTKSRFLLTDRLLALPHVEILNYDDFNDIAVSEHAFNFEYSNIAPDDIAYRVFDRETELIHCVTHQAAVTNIYGFASQFGFDKSTRLLSLNHHQGKAALVDVFATLSVGGTLVLPESQLSWTDINWGALVVKNRINTLHASSQQLSHLINRVEMGGLSSVSLVLAGGETSKSLLSKLKQHNNRIEFVSLNGIDAGLAYTAYSLCHENREVHDAYLPFGRALPGLSYKVLNEQGSECPDYVVGQLWATSGKKNDISDTSAQWLATHGSSHGLDWFNTGYFAYHLTGAEIQLCGLARDIKHYQGYMIEKQDIKSTLIALDGVSDVSLDTVLYQGAQVTLASLAITDPSIDQHQIQNTLAKRLPRHLLPSFYWLAPTLPLNSKGFINGEKVLQQCLALTETNQSHASISALLEAITYIFAKTIGADVSMTSADDDFFDSGGDSLLATHLTATINQYFKGSGLTIVDIFVERTPENLARKIEEKLPEMAEKIAQVLLKVIRKKQ